MPPEVPGQGGGHESRRYRRAPSTVYSQSTNARNQNAAGLRAGGPRGPAAQGRR